MEPSPQSNLRSRRYGLLSVMRKPLPNGESKRCLPSRKKSLAQKKPVEEQKTLLFIDESAFYPLPGVVRTWAPRGQTPLLHYPLTRDHLSVISAVTPEGDLYLTMQEAAFQSEGIVAFLDELQKQISGQLLIVWDGATIHRSKLLKQYLEAGASSRVHLERLPGYAPELNPDEGVWHYLKSVELGNVCSRDISQLRQELTSAVDHLSRKPEIIQACFQQVAYLS